MTIVDPFLLALPQLIATETDCLSRQDLQSLDEILAAIAANPDGGEDVLRNWIRQRPEIRDRLRVLDPSREISNLKANTTAKTGLTNYFQELRKAVREKLKQLPDKP